MCCYFMHLVCLWKPIMLKRKKKERETSNGVPKKILVTEKDEKCIWFHRTSFLFLRYLNICPKVFWFCKKKFDKERKVNFEIYDDVNWEINNYKTQIKLPKMGNIWIGIICFPVYDVMHFEINLSFLIKSFS